MNKLLTTTAIVGVLAAFSAPAFATSNDEICGCQVDIVLNGQFNIGSATTAIGVDAYGKKVKVNVNHLDVLAIGNMNDTTAHGGGHFRTSEKTRSSSYSKGGKKFDVSYETSVSRGRHYSASKSLSVSGSAWSKSGSKASTSARTSADRNRVFVGSLQVNFRSPTTAIGVDAGAGSRRGGGMVNVTVKNTTVTAVGNMNTTRLK